jgi:hypothetical protein
MVYDVHIARGSDDVEAVLKSPRFNIRTAAVLEEQPHVTLPPLTATPQWKTEITGYRNNSIDLFVETDHQGLLVLSETYYPGWKATVDGLETPLYRANYNLRALFVPAGRHNVKLAFQPASFAQGAMMTLGTLVVCCVGLILPSLRRKKRHKEESSGEERE